MKKILLTLSIILGLPIIALAAVFNSGQVGSTPSSGYVLQTNGSVSTWVATSSLGITGGGGGTGTVTSVGLTTPTGLSVSGSPVTTSGTFGLTYSAGYNLPLTASTTNWNTAYNNYVSSWTTPLQFSGGTASILQAGASQSGYLSSTDWNTFNNKTSNTGTVTSVGVGSTGSTISITGSPITTSGTINAELNLAHANTWTARQTFASTTFTGLNSTLLAVDGSGNLIATTSAGSGGGTWSTTTSTVAGELLNYPNNNTDIVTIGSNATSTAKFYFDPNIGQAVVNGGGTGTSTLQIGSVSHPGCTTTRDSSNGAYSHSWTEAGVMYVDTGICP